MQSNITSGLIKVLLAGILCNLILLHAECIGQGTNPLFRLTSPQNTGVTFANAVEERPGLNILEAEYFFNGGGVAAGDVNNDGLPDIYLTANNGSNALYLNEGDFRFREITRQAGVADSDGWSSGVAMADVNGDGLLDIYVCKTGKGDPEERRNRLFVNNGDLTFTERAEEYGLNDPGYSTHAVFFDYDLDGDLDAYIVNYSAKRYRGFDIRTIRNRTDPYAGDRLLRNDDGRFTDVSREARIIQNPIGFGLSATVSDLNRDGWPDIYVANDFMEKDYLYINGGNGTFSEEVAGRTTHISYFSMGADAADYNNDSFPDIFTADMLPDRYERMRMFRGPDYRNYHQLAAAGYHRQNMRNMLQLNNGDGTFTETGQLAGVDKTDWSWAVLMADFNNDGWKDVFVTNGFPRDYTNRDYLNKILWARYPDGKLGSDSEELFDLVQKMPEVRLHNHAFKNNGDLTFERAGKAWGLDHYAVSTGAAYADLDDDGDLDLIVNNLNEHAYLYRNRARQTLSNNYLKVHLEGTGMNRFGTGAKVTVIADEEEFFQEAYPTRGYQSSMEPVLLFGLGEQREVDVQVTWSDGSRQTMRNVPVNRTVTLLRSEADPGDNGRVNETDNKMFLPLDLQKIGLDFVHAGSEAVDLIRSPLLPHTLSNLGPALARADVNGDSYIDLFIGGGKEQAGRLLLQQKDGTFRSAEAPFFDLHKQYEDVDAVFFDAEGDGHPDLYVVSGGNYDPSNGGYRDRLYINDGFGRFYYNEEAIPEITGSGGTVAPADVDGDGDLDLFVGGRVLTGRYPFAPRSYLLENEGGQFRDITGKAIPALSQPGMIADAVWAHIDTDEYPDLVLAGEWMPIRIFKNNGDKTFTEITHQAGLEKTTGMWNVLRAVDLDRDGDMDLIAGNRGLNAAFSASPAEPAILYAGDFDGNGFIDPVLTQVIDGKRRPVAGRNKLLRQLPHLKERFPDYRSYATATIDDILDRGQQRKASRFTIHTFATTVFVNENGGVFRSVPLPASAQEFPVYDIIPADVNGDSHLDLLLAGNNFGTDAETGPIAGQGVILSGDEQLNFTARRSHQTGFRAGGEIRNMTVVASPLGSLVLLARNGDTPLVYLYRRTEKK